MHILFQISGVIQLLLWNVLTGIHSHRHICLPFHLHVIGYECLKTVQGARINQLIVCAMCGRIWKLKYAHRMYVCMQWKGFLDDWMGSNEQRLIVVTCDSFNFSAYRWIVLRLFVSIRLPSSSTTATMTIDEGDDHRHTRPSTQAW